MRDGGRFVQQCVSQKCVSQQVLVVREPGDFLLGGRFLPARSPMGRRPRFHLPSVRPGSRPARRVRRVRRVRRPPCTEQDPAAAQDLADLVGAPRPWRPSSSPALANFRWPSSTRRHVRR